MDAKKETLKYQNARIKWIICGLDWDSLTDWEQNFIESIEQQSDNGKMLSDIGDRKGGNSQMEIIERIYKQKG